VSKLDSVIAFLETLNTYYGKWLYIVLPAAGLILSLHSIFFWPKGISRHGPILGAILVLSMSYAYIASGKTAVYFMVASVTSVFAALVACAITRFKCSRKTKFILFTVFGVLLIFTLCVKSYFDI
jgi:hypothetical protein